MRSTKVDQKNPTPDEAKVHGYKWSLASQETSSIARICPRGQTYRVARLMYAIYESSVLAKNPPMSRISHVGIQGFLVESYRDLLKPDRLIKFHCRA
jgi:hypothetical protein